MTFRMWLNEKWFEHLDELVNLGLPRPEYDVKYYFNQYKYWLKREYKHQRNQNV